MLKAHKHKVILLTGVVALATEFIIPHGYTAVILTQVVASSQPARPVPFLPLDHDHQPAGGEEPTLSVDMFASGATNTSARPVTVEWPTGG